ncbi:RNA polymerase sigma factor [Novosphingobium sp. KACC 22771]|uniref:RNA polymerase sigma factor n=1 Tax=Novosphingobium sp. KACC 22771 TaxID=3025670 RepID=UPI0023659C1E|nr:RNA polymerase sigma factor [Novosphingobium sp. KACC 22771]WDF74223.1 RNA polymerase sigma factor [Novosphingobium sp. KACC 22771]
MLAAARRIILSGISKLDLRVGRWSSDQATTRPTSPKMISGCFRRTLCCAVRNRGFMSFYTERPDRAQWVNEPASQDGQDAGIADLSQLYAVEAPRLRRFFRARLRSGDEVGDLVQEAFARLVGAMAKDVPLRPAAYLQRIARNLLFNRFRQMETRRARFHLSFDDGYEHAIPPDQADRLELAEMMRIYRQALSELPDKTRQAFLLHRIEELTYREIGERLGLSIPTVQYHVARALAHIDAALEQE